MIKRTAAALFWFVTITWAYNYVGFYFSAPFLVGPLLAAAVSAFVGLDPLHVMWPRVRQEPHLEAPAHGAKTVTMPSAWDPGVNRAL